MTPRKDPKPKRKEPFGRPTKYKPEYCQEMITFFDQPFTRLDANGKEVANNLPTFERFAHTIGVNIDTLLEWSKVNDDFSGAYTWAKQLQKDFIIQNGTLGLYNPQFTIFVAKNITDMRDKIETEHSGVMTFANLFDDAHKGNTTEAHLQSGESREASK